MSVDARQIERTAEAGDDIGRDRFDFAGSVGVEQEGCREFVAAKPRTDPFLRQGLADDVSRSCAANCLR
jgi:hypothetical protein